MGKCRVFMRLTPAEAAAVRAFIRKPPSGPARLRAQAIWFSSQGHPVKEIAKEYGLRETQVKEALSFYQAHRQEMDRAIEAESIAEKDAGPSP